MDHADTLADKAVANGHFVSEGNSTFQEGRVRVGEALEAGQLIAAPRGGLGNQLFTLTAVLAVAVPRGWGVSLDLSGAAHPEASGQHPIASILPQNVGGARVSVASTRSSVGREVNRLRRGLAGRIPSIANYLKDFQSSVLGYDENLPRVRSGTIVHGYFQTFRYADQLRNLGTELDLGLPVPGSQAHPVLASLVAVRPIVLHVRRGDYRLDQNFGLVGPEYYHHAVDYLHEKVGNRPIWAFTDDPEYVKSRLPACDRVIGPDLGAMATLQLMTQAEAVVAANSSLSWWGAWATHVDRPIVAPVPWFRGLTIDLNQLLPRSWHRMPAFFSST